ncbi:hypothetical protein J8273_2407 [Carpediemonas membranifera]|uniref:Uncharacterized protein n=1 Tax=Carpediemonas membranifera TaxID=201153 RepID=A0A8J6EB26_9EUKA|nr:hypothetical protein J8273_2407 [Carpediemonas membranifera]|eukprot:KAG9396055.1 hypothetical protein J8273_2407 [Carpediemonas membranifera]
MNCAIKPVPLKETEFRRFVPSANPNESFIRERFVCIDGATVSVDSAVAFIVAEKQHIGIVDLIERHTDHTILEIRELVSLASMCWHPLDFALARGEYVDIAQLLHVRTDHTYRLKLGDESTPVAVIPSEKVLNSLVHRFVHVMHSDIHIPDYIAAKIINDSAILTCEGFQLSPTAVRFSMSEWHMQADYQEYGEYRWIEMRT